MDQKRETVALSDQWNLVEIYPSDDAWRAEKERVAAKIQEVSKFQDRLLESAGHLKNCLELLFDLSKELSRLYGYASMASDQDTRESKYLGMTQEMSQIHATFGAAVAFVEPEILASKPSVIAGFLKAEPGLNLYKHYLDDILRRQAHTGTAGEEKIIADASLMAGNAESVYSIFSNAEFPYPEITFSDGKTAVLNQASFSLARQRTDRDDRRRAFEVFFGRLNEYHRTFGTQLYGELRKNLFYKNARKYDSCLEAALDANNIPVAVYHQHIANTNAHIASFHRYLKLRKRILNLDRLHYYDLYAPLVSSVEKNYSVSEAGDLVLRSLEPLGASYQNVIRRVLNERWIDMIPTEGKRSGAYSNGAAYDVHPYILMNYKGKYDDVSTLTHELGHTMHSFLSNQKQPYPTSHYTIFCAEVASTFNEALLIEHALRTTSDEAMKLSLLGHYLEGFKGTIFRQTQFAEFELKIHELAESGEALTGDRFNELYLELCRKYYGHDQGICAVDDHVQIEWAYIPHFYYNFYVYQYATSFTASCALSEKTLAGDDQTTKRYLEFLSSGGSDYSIALLRRAGVDMESPEPMNLTMKKMNRIMDEMEAILGRMN